MSPEIIHAAGIVIISHDTDKAQRACATFQALEVSEEADPGFEPNSLAAELLVTL